MGDRRIGTVREEIGGVRTQHEKSDPGQHPAYGRAEPSRATIEGPCPFHVNLTVISLATPPPTKYSGSR